MVKSATSVGPQLTALISWGGRARLLAAPRTPEKRRHRPDTYGSAWCFRQPVQKSADVTAFDHPGVLLPPFPLEASPANQCPLGAAWSEGDACVRHTRLKPQTSRPQVRPATHTCEPRLGQVVAVVKFNGTLLTTPHNITTYVSTDGEAGTQPCGNQGRCGRPALPIGRGWPRLAGAGGEGG